MDPRFVQISLLSLILFVGVYARDFSIHLSTVFLFVVTALFVQVAADKFFRRSFNWKSAMITALSLSLLVRTHSTSIVILASALSIGSKFTLHYRRKHIFNPTNFGIVVLLLSGSSIWVSPGQWGSDLILYFVLICFGLNTAFFAERLDVSLAFLGSFSILLILRAAYLGQNLDVIPHQLLSGSLVLFSFFMISDPKTTPDHRAGRLLFGFLVAAASYVLRFRFFSTQAIFYALFFLSPLVPLIDRLLLYKPYEWSGQNEASKSPLRAPTSAPA